MIETKTIDITKRWIEEFIIGFNICPFAAYSFRNELIQYSVSYEIQRAQQLYDLFQLFVKMLSNNSDQLSNAFIIYPDDQTDFEAFYEMNHLAEALLEDCGYDKELQVVIFHPQFRYAEDLSSDPSNLTNRSPFPMIHVLRKKEVSHALENYEESESIPEKNKIKLQALNEKEIDAIRKLINN